MKINSKMKKLLLVVALCGCVLQAQAKNYYVKEAGAGNGSSWSQAMNNAAFAERLPLAVDGDTFHIAEGVYKPVVPAGGDTVKARYEVNANVTLIGGYPAEPEDGAASNPELYTTLFSGDHVGDDKIVYAPSTFGDGNDSITAKMDGRGDNSINLFVVLQAEKRFSVRGVSMTGAITGAIYSNVIDTFEAVKCKFYDMYGPAFYNTKSSALYMDSCDIRRCSFGERASIFMPVTVVGKVDHSVFVENGSYGKLGSTGGAVYLRNGDVLNSFFNKNWGSVGACIYMAKSANATVANCVFAESASDRGVVYINGTEKANVKNNTFINNKHIDPLAAAFDHQAELEVDIIGNIFIGEAFYHSDITLETMKGEISYNLFTQMPIYRKGDVPLSSTDTLLDLSSIPSLLGGKVVGGEYEPAKDKDGLPVLKLLADTYSNGKSLRFPLSVTNLAADINGVERCEMTCPGAYEIRDCDDSDVEELYAETLQVFPNPAEDEIIVSACEGMVYQIFSADGRTVKSGESSDGRIQISHLPQGIYTLHVICDKDVRLARFVKK